MKSEIIAAISGGMIVGSLAQNVEARPAKKSKAVNCFGLNKKKGDGACAVSEEQIKLAQSTFKGQYKKAETFECKGNNSCGAPDHLAWISNPSKSDCLQAGGFIFKKGEGSKLIIEKT